MLGGWLLLGETLSFRKDMGALIMLTGLIVSQIKFTKLAST
jgi:drug/metabolite transporter (DMT)-like permease